MIHCVPSADDDHYIANYKNAHIDTSPFEVSVRAQLSASEPNDEVLESVYNEVISRTSIAPPQLDDCQLICRYLSPEKFLRFLHTRHLNFPSAAQFSDARECCLPEDYETAVLRVLGSLEISADGWSNLVRRRAAVWNISCWTRLDDYFDDHLMWDCYAGGSWGVGITVRYGILRSSLAESARGLAVDGELYGGSVNYETLCLLPFNKHYMFRNEKEARFAFRSSKPGPKEVSVEDVFGSFGVRISPAASAAHCEMIRRLWLGYGGEDRVQWPH